MKGRGNPFHFSLELGLLLPSLLDGEPQSLMQDVSAYTTLTHTHPTASNCVLNRGSPTIYSSPQWPLMKLNDFSQGHLKSHIPKSICLLRELWKIAFLNQAKPETSQWLGRKSHLNNHRNWELEEIWSIMWSNGFQSDTQSQRDS